MQKRSNDSPRPMERLGFAALLLFTLSPIVVHGISCPLARALHTNAHLNTWGFGSPSAPYAPNLNALALTFAALGVAAAAWLVHVVTWSRKKTWIATTNASLVALLSGALLGKSPAGIAAATLALVAVAFLSGGLLPWIVSRLPEELDGLAPRRKVTTALVVLLGIVTVLQTARISTFIGDHTRAELSVVPSVPFIVNHSCLTAYVEAARLSTEGAPNIYDAENWPDLSHSARSASYQKRYAPFALDAFAYPPPFLLLPRLLLPLPDFLAQRALWFALNGLLIAIGLWTVARYVGGQHRIRVLLLAPLVLVSLPSIVALQVGNVHAAVMVLAMLAMVAFESKRPALGGAMLAFAIASKISPGLLVVVLLVQRRFREVLWTAAFGLGFVLLSLVVFGSAPLEAFVTYQMPMLSSGKALSFLAEEVNIPLNLAPFGVPFKLAFLGVPVSDPWKVAKYVNQGFTAAILVVTVLAARKNGSPQMRTATWLAILTLGTLRSPFAPGYVTFPVLWLLSVNSTEVRCVRATILLVVAWLMLALPTPMPGPHLTIFSFAQQGIIMTLLLYSLFRNASPKTSAAGMA